MYLSFCCLLFTSWLPGEVLGLPEKTRTRIPGPACEDGLVLDDGTMETGYGWVPSAVWGEYVQRFSGNDLNSTILDSICVCWTRTREDDSIDFEVVLYRDRGGFPAEHPWATFPVHAEGVPLYGEGRFFEIPLAGLSPVLPGGDWDIGVRWNPSEDQFFFLCADHSPTDHPAAGFFRDDRAEGEWGDVLDTSDSVFDFHAAMMIRPRPLKVGWVPLLNPSGMAVMVLLLAFVGWLVLRKA